MKIIHLTSVHSPTDTRIFSKMCRSLVARGVEAHLVVPSEGPATQVCEGVVVHSVAPPHGRLDRMLRTVGRVLERAEALQGDIYHFHDPEFLRRAPAFQRRMGRPVIYDAHEDVRAQILGKPWLPKWTRGWISRRFGRIEDWAAPQLAAVVSATPKIAERFARHSHSIIVQNFPLLSEFADLDERRPVAGRLAYVGEMTAIRGIREVIEALPLLKDVGELNVDQAQAGSPHHNEVRLALAGRWEDGRFRAQMMRLPGWKQVEEAGQLDRAAVRRHLASAVAGVVLFAPLPNHVDAQPTKMFEYMAAGVAVLASDFPWWRGTIDKYRCGVTANPEDPSDIARAIRWLMEHPEETLEMGRRGREAVLSQLNWETEFEKLMGLYEEASAEL